MAKDPAFLFYSSDFLSGIQDLTMEERGQYITLLCLQHQKGRLSDKIIKLSVGNATADVMAKFRQDSSSLWYNERLELETQKRKDSAEKQRQRALDGWEKRKKDAESKATANATALPLEDEDVNTITNEDEINLSNAAKKILTDFGFNEISGMDKLRKIKEALNYIFRKGQLDYFSEQYGNYIKFKKQNKERIHGIDNFFDTENQYKNPGWDSNTWSLLITNTSKPDKMTETVKAFAQVENPFRK